MHHYFHTLITIWVFTATWSSRKFPSCAYLSSSSIYMASKKGEQLEKQLEKVLIMFVDHLSGVKWSEKFEHVTD